MMFRKAKVQVPFYLQNIACIFQVMNCQLLYSCRNFESKCCETTLLLLSFGVFFEQNGADESQEEGVVVDADSNDGAVLVNGNETEEWGTNNDGTPSA